MVHFTGGRPGSTARTFAVGLSIVLTLAACSPSGGVGSEDAKGVLVDDVRADAKDRPSNVRERIARSLTYSGMRGVAEGVIVSNGRSFSVDDTEGRAAAFTAYEFHVETMHGVPAHEPPLYASGDRIELVVPGGEVGDLEVVVEDAVQIAEGDRLLIWVQTDIGSSPAGRVTDDRLVVTSPSNIAPVTADAVRWSADVEVPYDTVISILESNPCC